MKTKSKKLRQAGVCPRCNAKGLRHRKTGLAVLRCVVCGWTRSVKAKKVRENDGE